MRLYAELQRRFPSSAEAKLSHVSMGKLLLSVGKFADAERKFSDYLAAGGGPLSEEAWVGEAQSFRGQGRAADERRAWRELLQRFPSSVYAQRARQQLAEADP
jgi:TolA-binding protein